MSEFVESILAEHKKRHQEEEPEEDSEAGKYFSVLKIEGVTTDFLELRFRNGAAFFLSYSELDYFNYDPSGVIDMICGSFTVEIHGRNLRRLLDAIKGKKVAWIREADKEAEDVPENESFIANIYVQLPKGFGEQEEPQNAGE